MMNALLIKEIKSYFSSLVGYLVIVIFLLAIGLYMWFFGGDTNIFVNKTASLETLFAIAPWVFLFLVPAVTMRLFAEERRIGTLELLLTKPISELRIVMAKYFAAIIIVLLALLPTIVYFFSIHYFLSDRMVDVGATIGSYIGLVFLAAIYTAIGLWASSLTNNQIVAFMISILSIFFVFIGFEYISKILTSGIISSLLDFMSINSHYNSISRGIVDSSDIVYFLSVIVVFIFLTYYSLVKSKTNKDFLRRKILKTSIVSAISILLINIASQYVFFRYDLTAEKRYTLTDFTRNTLRNLQGQVDITIYLSGKKLPVNFKKFQKSIEFLLWEFKRYAGNKIKFTFVDIYSDKISITQRREIFKELNKYGVYFVQNTEVDKLQSTQSIIIPGGILEYSYFDKNQNREIKQKVGLNLLDFATDYQQTSEQNINNSTQTLEYKFLNEITKLSQPKKPKIVFLEGQGELEEPFVIDFERTLSEYYEILRGEIKGRFGILDSIDLLIIAKPTKPFDDVDKYIIDQFIMRGGKVLWLVDGINVSMDSIYLYEKAFAFPANTQMLKIDDLLFNYGVRINTNIVQDLICSTILLKAQSQTGQPIDYQYKWYYFPLLITNNDHPINKYIDAIRTEFVSTIDTVGANSNILKTPLLTTSNAARVIEVNFPIEINFKEIMQTPDVRLFNKSRLPIAYLLEGQFTSLWKGRINRYQSHYPFQSTSVPNKMIVVADGDIIKNVVKSNKETMPMDFDKFSLSSFKGARQFLINAVNYLLDDQNIMQLRMRQIKLRLIYPNLTQSQIASAKFVNVFLPLLIIAIGGWIFNFLRKRKYTKF